MEAGAARVNAGWRPGDRGRDLLWSIAEMVGEAERPDPAAPSPVRGVPPPDPEDDDSGRGVPRFGPALLVGVLIWAVVVLLLL
jgi:hypothetical protein